MNNSMNLIKKLAPYTIVAIGIALVAVGVYRQETMQILAKAVTVCLECIGIG